MKIKQLLYMAGLAVVAVACSNDDAVQTSSPQGQVPVTLSYATQPQQRGTRAAAATNLNEDYLVSGKQVTVRISEAFAEEFTDYTYTTGESGVLNLPTSPSPIPYYPLEAEEKVDILAYYPAYSTANFSIQTDQTSSEAYAASDLMWATPLKEKSKTEETRTLQFSHKMAKIIVNVHAGTAIGEINSVTLKQVQPTVSMNKTTGNITSLSGSAGDVKIVKDETAANVSGAAVIPEQTIDGAFLEIGVTKIADPDTGNPTGTGIATYAVDSKLFEAGKYYVLDITVSWPEVGATTAITNWTENGTATVNTEELMPRFLTFDVGGVDFTMVYVEGTDNNFTLSVGNQTTPGSGTSATYVNQIVKGLSDYYIGQTEVTNDLWVAVMGGTAPSEKSKANNFPVTNVTYTQLMGTGDGTAEDCFIKKLNDLAASQLPMGIKFTLPSQVQWQYAAQGGKYSNGYTYAGSSTWGDSFWNGDNSGSTTHQVATKPANELGLYDMSGNVWECCGDWYYEATNNAELAKDYWCDTVGSYRVIRGGCWSYPQSTNEAYLQPRFRYARAPSTQNDAVGFRLALQIHY